MSKLLTAHNHFTRDIRPHGECPACDRYHHSENGANDYTKGVLFSENCQVCGQKAERLSRAKMPPNQGGIKYICDSCVDELEDYWDRNLSENKEIKNEVSYRNKR